MEVRPEPGLAATASVDQVILIGWPDTQAGPAFRGGSPRPRLGRHSAAPPDPTSGRGPAFPGASRGPVALRSRSGYGPASFPRVIAVAPPGHVARHPMPTGPAAGLGTP